MEKLEEISYGSKGRLLKIGSLLMLIMVFLIMYIGYNKITVPKYADVQIVISEENTYLISKSELKNIEEITLGEDVFTIHLSDYEKGRYIVNTNSLSKELSNVLRNKILINGRIFLKNESLFEALLPINL